MGLKRNGDSVSQMRTLEGHQLGVVSVDINASGTCKTYNFWLKIKPSVSLLTNRLLNSGCFHVTRQSNQNLGHIAIHAAKND